ncbi:MAG: YwaF family protein [Dorea sp.]|jgi:hypothetical protein|nr:YwaF family protein [Dorea sp.]GFI43629.1 hypothetical protein IMSAGC018_01304 [Lachnospiraceae bacterium]
MKKHSIEYKKVLFYCGILMFLSESWKQYCLTYLVNKGIYDWWYFPFQLCSIPMYVCLLFPFISSKGSCSLMLTFLMDFGLLGGIFTFFDTTGMYYSYLPLTIHSFAWHILLILMGIYAGCTGKADYSKKGYAKAVCGFLVCCLFATLFNLFFYPYGRINMFYISPYYQMGQLVFRDIARILGNGIGIASYILAILTGAGLLHLIWNYCSHLRCSQ